MADRTVILHYHLFKNAGTSFDGILKRNFPGRWVSAEFAGGNNSAAVSDWIAANPDAVAFSSHTATGPVPVIPGVRVISVLFLRDPVARIRSAYQFERRQTVARDNDRMGVHLAAKTDFEGYVRGRLAVPGDRQCRNFHCVRLAGFVRRSAPELERAIEGLGVISHVGEVERFGRGMLRFAARVREVWPTFDPSTLHLNRTEAEEPVEIGPDLARLLAENNALDHALIDHARRTLWKD
ncbi:MAG: hypothetical protein ACT4OK_11715 [Gemmobacter sp.]